MHGKTFFVYLLTSLNKSVLYTGVTNNLHRRIIEHYEQRGKKATFAGKYNVFYLLYYEEHQSIIAAIAREKEIKGWRREKKMELIVKLNPELKFLNREFFGEWPLRESGNKS